MCSSDLILAHVTTSERGEAGTTWPPELVARMKAAHMSLIPTLTLFDVEMQRNHVPPEVAQQEIALAVSQLHAYASAGGQILFGTDIGYIDHYDTAEEFQLMSRAGMTFPLILTSLTTSPAQRFGHGLCLRRCRASVGNENVGHRAPSRQDHPSEAKSHRARQSCPAVRFPDPAGR